MQYVLSLISVYVFDKRYELFMFDQNTFSWRDFELFQ